MALSIHGAKGEDVNITRAIFRGPFEGSPGGPLSLTSLSSGVACDSYWTSVHPEYWTKRHVWEWLQFCCDQYKLDTNCISFCHFNISGLQLCSMTQEEFIEAAGVCGEYLYFILQNIRSQGQCPGARTRGERPHDPIRSFPAMRLPQQIFIHWTLLAKIPFTQTSRYPEGALIC